ncbi:helix-turn-helix transcriptional regulator [Sinanaerobacter sp. ZZT-01]|uniref:helix-turn-helix domain-containing protein n=1 Tax=Sinanaerobacter sp. ZZT-01 TaxID=3111540 RepID=UPI002D778677|nr:helix-turn-helix transcriptional regulator [Sinanaerobacter sp. ZZT-01]WRR94224.1 helix-turn-helix transcriptional regulator [Sinanaerobacter sp. ZZT-01]
MEKNRSVFAERLIALRKEKRLTQQELGNLLKVTRSTIAGYEKEGREPEYMILIAISKFFHVSTDYLLGCSNNRNSNTRTISLSKQQYYLLRLFNFLNNFNRGVLLERATYLLEKQQKIN